MTFTPHKPYDRTRLHGHTFNWRTKAMLLEAERRLGYTLTIDQGSYNASVGASAGTHDGGGAVDLAPWDWQHKVHVLRAIGFDAWHRPAIPGLWGEHIHAIAHKDREASPAAKAQMVDYAEHRDGLADNAEDDFPFHPDPPRVFDYQAWQAEQRLSSRLKDLVRKRESVARTIAKVRNRLSKVRGS